MNASRNRVVILHGVNLDALGRRDPDIYGTFTLNELEHQVRHFALDLDLEPSFFQTNHEGELCEQLNRSPEFADGIVLNAGAWTHYSYAIRDALEVAGLPAVEVHISAISNREDWRKVSVFSDLCIGQIEGKGIDGYREALELLADTFA